MSAKAYKINSDIEDAQNVLERTVHATSYALGDLFGQIDECISAARDAYYERSEAWQDSAAGAAADEWVSDWENYRDSVEQAMTALDEVIQEAPSETAADY